MLQEDTFKEDCKAKVKELLTDGKEWEFIYARYLSGDPVISITNMVDNANYYLDAYDANFIFTSFGIAAKHTLDSNSRDTATTLSELNCTVRAIDLAIERFIEQIASYIADVEWEAYLGHDNEK